MITKTTGKKAKVVLGIDGTNMYCHKEGGIERSPGSYLLY